MLSRALLRLRRLYFPIASPCLHRPHRHFSKSSDHPPDGISIEKVTFENSKSSNEDEELFSPENTKDMSKSEVARLRLLYGLIREHVQAVKRGIAEVDPTSNPLLDPRSFEIRRLPRLPDEVLKHFRREVPSDVAENTRPVATRNVWESLASGTAHELVNESANSAAEWDRVDEQTMSRSALLRRNRGGNLGGVGSVGTKNVGTGLSSLTPFANRGNEMMGAFGSTRSRKRKHIVLRNAAGRVDVDFRAVATLKMFLSETGKIIPRRKSHLSAKSQRKLAKAIKRARTLALIDPAPTGPTMAELAAMYEAEHV